MPIAQGMTRLHVIHPSSPVRESHLALLQACGWWVSEAGSRHGALDHLAGPAAHRFGDLVLVDLSDWAVPGTALIRSLRRQLASPLPVVAVLPDGPAAEQAAEAARRAGANLLLPASAPPHHLLAAISLMTGQALPALLPWLSSTDPLPQTLGQIWQHSLDLLALPDHAAATVVSARRVFELLLSRREDDSAAEAALALTALAGGPVPLQRWARAHHPAAGMATPAGVLPQPLTRRTLVVDAGGQCYGLPLDADAVPACWWTDSGTTAVARPGLPLVRLLGISGFRRLLATDRATVVLRDALDASAPDLEIRVDEVIGPQSLLIEPVSDLMRRASGCCGLSRTREGQPVLVLDAASLRCQLVRYQQQGLAAPR